jgi:hypothetical protein
LQPAYENKLSAAWNFTPTRKRKRSRCFASSSPSGPYIYLV